MAKIDPLSVATQGYILNTNSLGFQSIDPGRTFPTCPITTATLGWILEIPLPPRQRGGSRGTPTTSTGKREPDPRELYDIEIRACFEKLNGKVVQDCEKNQTVTRFKERTGTKLSATVQKLTVNQREYQISFGGLVENFKTPASTTVSSSIKVLPISVLVSGSLKK